MQNLFRKRKKNNIFKIVTIAFSFLLLILTLNYYVNYKYSKITSEFYSEFNNCNFTDAKSLIDSDNIYLKLKKKTLNNDLNTYFSGIVNNICDTLSEDDENKDKALIVLNEIKSYDILKSSINKLIISLDESYEPEDSSDYEALLSLGLDNCDSGNFETALNFLKKIPADSDYSEKANEYIEKCISNYKESIFNEADELANNDYYTKAINLLNNIDTSIVSKDDSDIQNKITSIAEAKESYLASLSSSDSTQNSTSTSSELLNSITSSNINTLNLESLTSNLIYVSLADQITYVYKGSMNKWDKIKSFTCSTGIDGENTPTGVYDVRERGDWFFSDKYNQGGKYWVQFYGDYLFHSVPYNEDQSEVVDNTLGTPASHGCIRLKTEDAKWLYDNIEAGTKVIIK